MNRKIKLVYIISNLGIGGAQILLLNILKQVKGSGFYEVSVITLNKGIYTDTVINMGISVFNLNCKNLINPIIFIKLYKLLKKIKPDIVHTHLLKADFYGRISSRLAGIKHIVSTYHTNSSSHKIKKGESKNINDYLDNLSIRFSHCHIIAVSEKVKDYVIKKTENRNHKIAVIGNGINIDDFVIMDKEEKNTLKKQLKLDCNDYLITFAGRLEIHKGIDFFLESLKDYIKKNKNIKIIVIGTGNLEQYLINFIIQNDLTDNINLLGFKHDVNKYIQISDLVVVPSIVEGFGLIILESMLCKVPVLASNAGAIPEIIKDKYNGYLFQSGNKQSLIDSLDYIINQKDSETILTNAYNIVTDRYNIKNVAGKYISFYKHILE